MRSLVAGVTLAVGIFVVIGFSPGAARGALPGPVVQGVPAVGLLDCNGHSTIQNPLHFDPTCAHPRGAKEEFTDNGYYVGHDEPNLRFISNSPGSANNVTFKMVLPGDNTSAGGKPGYKDYIAFWLGMALCDNRSYPQHACINNSDNNTGLGTTPKDAGSAVLEMQFYPPGFPDFFSAVSCDATHWCASLHINSLECNFGFVFCNPVCTEPTNFAFVTKNGLPIGPPSPALANFSTFNGSNPNVFKMNPGDIITASIHDTPAGLFTGIHDLTTKKSGFMVASAANGFASLALHTCAQTFYSFHPEYDTAATNNIVPWAALQLGISLDIETGHYEALDGHDADDSYCLPSPTGLPACLSTDFDFDGVPYTPNGWPTRTAVTATHASPVNLLPMAAHFLGPKSHGTSYPIFELLTEIGFVLNSTTSCNILAPNNCELPNSTLVPTFGGFYPYFSLKGCAAYFGNVHGTGINDFGGDAGYGSSVPVFTGTLAIWGTTGAYYTNTC